MDRAIERSSDKLVWYRETIKTKKKVSGPMHVLPKYITKRFYPSALRGNATAQVRPLMLLAFGELHISVDVSTLYVRCHRRMETGRWYQQDEINEWRQSHSKMKSSHGGKVTAR
jgi:hypothetical protein